MANLILTDFNAVDVDYVEKLNANNDATEAAVNAHEALLQSTVGTTALLLARIFDRDGVVGEESYRLDLENYDGGTTITIGRRPAPNPAFGQVDISFLRGTFASGPEMVQQTGDVALNANVIVGPFPKTIFIGIAATGAPAFFPDTTTPFVTYIYSMTWNAFTLADIQRLVPTLAGHETIARMAARPFRMQVFDPLTDWVTETTGKIPLFTFGNDQDNGIGIDEFLEVIGFWVMPVGGVDGFSAPFSNPPESVITFQVESDAEVWTKDDLVVDCGQAPDMIGSAVLATDPPGLLRYVDIIRRFELKRVGIGSGVVSAQNIVWGLWARNVLGSAVAKDTTKVDQP